MQPFLSNALGLAGDDACSAWSAAYAMFANGGERVEPRSVDRVQDRYGLTI
jgi:penicillin-binding protein 1A